MIIVDRLFASVKRSTGWWIDATIFLIFGFQIPFVVNPIDSILSFSADILRKRHITQNYLIGLIESSYFTSHRKHSK